MAFELWCCARLQPVEAASSCSFPLSLAHPCPHPLLSCAASCLTPPASHCLPCAACLMLPTLHHLPCTTHLALPASCCPPRATPCNVCCSHTSPFSALLTPLCAAWHKGHWHHPWLPSWPCRPQASPGSRVCTPWCVGTWGLLSLQ